MFGVHWILLVTLAGTGFSEEQTLVYPESAEKYFTPPASLDLREDALFGYSVAYQRDNKFLLIGSPKADNYGELFRCDINLESCARLQPIADSHISTSDHAWLGATVKAGSSFFLVCAPRGNRHTNKTNGECRFINKSTAKLELAQQLTTKTLLQEAQKNFLPGDNAEYSFDSFGWSMEVSDDDVILVGGPAMSIGRVMVYEKVHDAPKLLNISNQQFKTSNGSVSFNFGYSIASGKFFTDKITYAVSSPYGEIGKGKVLFFNNLLHYERVTIVDNDLGALFGAALCFAQLGGVRASLLVGAPVWAPAISSDSAPAKQIGAVHLYVGSVVDKKRTVKHHKTIAGYEDNGYFGVAIAGVGDLNGDGMDEVAISAPYEDEGRGAVYIYSGAELFKEERQYLTARYLQRVAGGRPEHHLGLSLSPVQDYDENGCNELAIGIPGGNKVMLLRCRAFITVHLHAHFPDLRTSDELLTPDGNFYLEPCLNVSYSEKPKLISTVVLVEIKVSHPNATISTTDQSYEARLGERKPTYCKKIKVNLPKFGDYDRPIKFNLTATIQNPPASFKADHAVLSDHSNTSLYGTVSPPGSNLTFQISTSIRNGYLIGSTPTETVSIYVQNSGNTAYGACVRLRITGGATAGRPTEGCAQANNILTCSPMSPLKDNVTMEIELDMNSITSDSKRLVFEAKLFSDCKSQFGIANNRSTVELTSDSEGIIIKGTSTPTLTVTKTELSFGHLIIKHFYTILNSGVTNWGEMKNYFVLPPHVSTTLSLDSSDDCPVTNDGRATCFINKLSNNDSIDIVLKIEILPGTTFSQFLNGTISSELNLMIGDKKKALRITSQILLNDATVPVWIIVVSAIVGILLLIIVVFVLRECGCLRRKKKEELESLKRDIKRQTIRRSMMISTANKAAEDLQTLIANEAAATASQRYDINDQDEQATGRSQTALTKAEIHCTN